jgi:phage-related protein
VAGPGGRTAGRVSVRVVPDTSKFRKDLTKDLEKLERSLTVKIPTRIDTKRVARDAARVNADLQRQLANVDVNVNLNTSAVGKQIDRLARDRTATIRPEIDRAALAGASQALGLLAQSMAGLGRRAVGLSAATAGIAALASGAASAVVPVVQLGTALAPLAGFAAALPAVAGAAGAAMGTLAVATVGVGDALGAIVEGDAEKISEALDKLSPAARSLAREFEDLLPALRDVQQEVQESLFAPLEGEVERLGERLLPTLTTGMVDVADAAGGAARQLTEFAGSGRSLAFLDALFASTATSIRNAESALPNFLSGLAAIGTAGLPFVEELGTALDVASERFRAWADEAVRSGDVTAWIEDAVDTLSQLGDIAGNVAGIIGSIFSAAGDGGLLATIENLTGEMDEFLSSAEGMEALEGLFEGLSLTGSALSPVLSALVSGIGALAPAIGRIARAFGPVLTSAIDGLVPALAELEPGIIAVVEALGDAVDVLVETGALEQIATAFSEILIALAPLLPLLAQLAAVVLVALADVLVMLAPHIAALVSELADSLAPVLPELSAAFAELIEAIAPLIPPLVEALLPVIRLLPELLTMIAEQTSAWATTLTDMQPVLIAVIGAVGWLLEGLVALVSWVLQTATSFFIWVQSARQTAEEVGTRVGKMVGKVIQDLRDMRDDAIDAFVDLRDRAISLVARTAARIVHAFVAARDGAIAMVLSLARGVISGISSAVRFVASLPSRVLNAFRSARSWLKYAGMNIIFGLMDGINSAVRHLYDQMSGIARNVRNYWPFSPAKVGPLRSHPMDKAGFNLASMLAEGMAQGQHLVTQASNRLALAAAAPSLVPTADLESTAATAATGQAETLAALVRQMERMTGGDIVVTVDGQEIARAARRGERDLARR